MCKNIEVSFYVPEEIAQGLEKNFYEITGGIIRNKHTGEIVYWLREGDQSVKNVEKIMIKLTSLGKATLALADFIYMNDNLKDIKKKLEDNGLKLDSQNMSKIESGFLLSKEAELTEDYESLRVQMIRAMSLLEEGSNICRNIYEQQRKNDKQNKFTSYDSLRMVVLSQMGIIRSYAHLGEYNIATLRIQKLRKYLLDCALWYCNRCCYWDTEWNNWIYIWIYIAPLYIPGKIMYKFKNYTTVEWKIFEEITRSRKENVLIKSTLGLYINKMQELNVDIPYEVQELIDHLNYIDGYSLEIEAYKQKPVIFKKICEEISNKGTMDGT